MSSIKLSAQSCQIITARNAKKFIGKEVIVVGKLCSYSNSSYLQSAWFCLGPDSIHKQLMVYVQGANYLKGNKTWIGSFIGKKIKIKGIVKNDKGVYLDATDTLKLK